MPETPAHPVHAALAAARALVLDCDGTLVDTETAYDQAWDALLRERGCDVTAADLVAVRGLTWLHCLERFQQRWAGLEDVAALRARYEELVTALLRRGVPAWPDAAALLEHAVATGLPAAVASNSGTAHVRQMLDLAGLARLVPVVVGSDEVVRPKPAPDLYLEAARRLDVAPERCLAVEDSPTGVASARDAGMTVLGVARDGQELGGTWWHGAELPPPPIS